MWIQNLTTLYSELKQLVQDRMQKNPVEIEPRIQKCLACCKAETMHGYAPDPFDAFITLVAFIPHAQPAFYDNIIAELLPEGGEFIEFGGVRGVHYRGFLPTVETALYLMAGNDLEAKGKLLHLFSPLSFLSRMGVMAKEEMRGGEPITSGRLILSPEFEIYLMTGEMPKPQFSPDFPAKRINTSMDWEDLVLHPTTTDLINDVKMWMHFHDELHLDISLSRKIKPGYKCLFHGPSGTGKTLTAMLIGKHFNKDVYRIDLSQIVSKYIGETEKNLEKIFAKAENTDWILFFDEADSLFGKRSGVQSSNDKYANQEVSYLLQRIEDFNGLIILASNFKNNIDPAFIRRFNSIIHFPVPDAKYRLQLWQKTEPQKRRYDQNISLDEIALKFELTGASILNVVHYATLKSIAGNNESISYEDLIEGIRKELQKEDKFVREN